MHILGTILNWAEYKDIADRIERLLDDGVISEYTKCTIMDMSGKVLEHIARKYENIREGVKQVMGGRVLDHEAKRIKNEGIKEGRAEGIVEGRGEGMVEGRAAGIVETGVDFGLSDKEILDKLQVKLKISLQMAQEYFLKYGKRTV